MPSITHKDVTFMLITNPTATVIHFSLLDSFTMHIAPNQVVEIPDHRFEVCQAHGLIESKPKAKKATKKGAE